MADVVGGVQESGTGLLGVQTLTLRNPIHWSQLSQ
jgi:hypothetical protein